MSAVTIWDVPPTTAPRRRHLQAVPDLPAQGAAPRLTVRGRRVLALLVLLLLAGAGAAAASASTSGPATAVPVERVTVGSEQTLSQVAARTLPGVPLSEAVVRIQLANGLNSLQVQPGQQLLVPAA